VILTKAQLDELINGEVADAFMEQGQRIAQRAAMLAPRDTGEGARSIQAKLFWIHGEPEVRVSWTREHFYMGFAELGTSRQSPTPFLRPAAH
jgi:HK97 gp10 family phage protein